MDGEYVPDATQKKTMTLTCNVYHYVQLFLFSMFLFLSLSLSLSAFDWSFCVYFCMFPVCPLCCFIVISMDLVSEINDDDDDEKRPLMVKLNALLGHIPCVKNRLKYFR